MKKLLYLVFTSLICINFAVCAVFAESEDPDTFSDFTDQYGNTLINITSSVDRSHLRTVLNRQLVIDQAHIVQSSGRFSSVTPAHNSLYFTGSYYDNTITALEGCSSSSYHYNTQSHTIDGVTTVEPGLYASLGHSSQNMMLNIGLDVEVHAGAQETITVSGFDNTTQACALIGMNDGDGAIDGTILTEAGYIQKTITYNDGSLNGHTATFYVPGSEEFSFMLDTQYLTNVINGIMITFNNSLLIDYHYAADLSLTSDGSIPVPEYGQLASYAYLGMILNYDGFIQDSALGDIFDIHWYEDPAYSVPTTAYANYPFDNQGSIVNNRSGYYNNDTELTYQGTSNPHWYFRTNEIRYSWSSDSSANPILNGRFGSVTDDYVGMGSILISSDFAEDYPDQEFIVGYSLPVSGFNVFSFYQLQDSGRLGLFNQLGSFLQTQFNRLKNAIDGISGTDGDTVVNIENEYDVDVEYDIDNYLGNVFDRKDDIDLTLPDFNLPAENQLNVFSNVPLETIKIFTDNDLGIFIFLPLIIALLGLIL